MKLLTNSQLDNWTTKRPMTEMTEHIIYSVLIWVAVMVVCVLVGFEIMSDNNHQQELENLRLNLEQ